MRRICRTLILASAMILMIRGQALTVSVVSMEPARCGLPNGSAQAFAQGGLQPYTYTWSNGEAGSVITGLAAGEYTVTVLDGGGETTQATVEVEALWELDPSAGGSYCLERPACSDLMGALYWVSVYEPMLGGTPPYTYNFPDQVGEEHLVGVGYGEWTFLEVTDHNGCSISWNIHGVDKIEVAFADYTTLPSCGGGANGGLDHSGSVVVVRPDGTVVYTGQASEAQLEAGDYLVGRTEPGTGFMMGEGVGDFLAHYGTYPYDVDDLVQILDMGWDYCTMPSWITVEAIPGPCGPEVGLGLHLFLGGAYDPMAGLMRDDLRSLGLLPTTEPYTDLGYVHHGNGGGETVEPARLAASGPNAIVDWVVVELRDAMDPAAILHSASGLLQRDGTVVDSDGGTFKIPAPEGDYYVAVRHRNHLGVMIAERLALGVGATVIDFTVPGTATWGTDGQMIAGDALVLWPGDVNRDGQVKYTGGGNDRDVVLDAIGGEMPINVLQGYHNSDINLDGQVKYTGTANDRDRILDTIGGEVPTRVIQQQLPD